VFRNILVAYDGSAPARAALAQAIDLAQAQNAQLTVLTVAPPVSSYVGLGGLSSDQLKGEIEAWADRVAREAVAEAPEGVIVHHLERSGRVGEEIVKELDQRGYDLVVLGSRGRSRVESNVLGTVNGYVHYHSRTAQLVVQAPDDDG
jgi:nucleotide-binding universal stress UspA family protein